MQHQKIAKILRNMAKHPRAANLYVKMSDDSNERAVKWPEALAVMAEELDKSNINSIEEIVEITNE